MYGRYIMDIEFLITFFSYFALVNVVLLIALGIITHIKVLSNAIKSGLKMLYGTGDKDVKESYHKFLTLYKAYTVFFSIAPLITLLVIKSM